MQEAATRRSIPFFGRSRIFRQADFDEFDLILAMDRNNLADLQSARPKGKHRAEIRLFGSFVNPSEPPEVPDPYYGGEAGFQRVIDILEDACANLLRQS